VFRHIRSKLIAAFAVPLAILVAVAGLESVSALGQVNSVDRQTALASASVGPGGVVQALQREREFAELSIIAAAHKPASALVGLSPSAGGFNQTPADILDQTDVALSSFRSTVDHAGAQAEQIYTGAFAALSALSTARGYWAQAATDVTAKTAKIVRYQTLATKTYQSYTNMINALVGATAQVPLLVSDTTLRTGVEALYTSLQKTESDWQVVEDLIIASWESGSAQTAQFANTNQDWGADVSWTQRLASLGTGTYQVAMDNLDQDQVVGALAFDIGLIQTGAIPPLTSVLDAFTAPAGNTATTANVTFTQLGENEIAAIVNSRANTLHNNAVIAAIEFGVLGAFGTILGFLLIALVSRSVSKPLIDLANQADKLATETLPATVKAILEAANSGAEPPKPPKVVVNSRDEVSEMARALDAVNKTAVELATGQAALRRNLADAFVNLGRRNQNLVTRQLEYISEIELKEADPESLEELFRLDHLATRMRRNAESLLILAGSGPARQWSAAVPAMDVARAASAEVEDYKRLRLHHFDPAMMTGAVTTDLVHIMAELVENALTFSPPGSPVDVYGRFLEGGYVIVIVDSGIGMSVEDLDLANHRLGGEGSESEVPGRYLGHFVAGRLAARHSIAISLQSSHSGGLVARVKIPATLIEDPVPDLSAVAEVRSASQPDAYEPAAPSPHTPFEDRVFESPFTALTPDEDEMESPAGPSPVFEAPSSFQSPAAFQSPPAFEAPAPSEAPPAYEPPAPFAPARFEAPPAFEAPVVAEVPAAAEATGAFSAPEVPETPAAPEAQPVFEAQSAFEAPAVPEPVVPAAPVVSEALAAPPAPAGFGAPKPFDTHDAYETPAVFAALANFEAAVRAPGSAAPEQNEPKSAPADPFFASTFGTSNFASHAGQVPDEELRAGQDDIAADRGGETAFQVPFASPSSFEVGGEIGYRAQEPTEEDHAYLPKWAGEISEPSWDYGETEPEESAATATSDAVPSGAPAIVPFDWAAPAPSGAPTLPSPAGSNGATADGSHSPSPFSAPAPDHAWDPVVAQKDTSGKLEDQPSIATSPPATAPARPAWASSIDHGVSIASARPAPEPGAWDPAVPTTPLAARAATELNPTGFTPTSPVELISATFSPNSPDLGISSTLVTGPTTDPSSQPTAPAETSLPTGAATSAPSTATASWDTVPPREAAPGAEHAIGPAEQARNTADGLRRLTRRVPGASLPQEDGSLRRPTPTSTTHNPIGLTGALSQYLSATANEGRPEKEHNAR
jgi:signal transduction histidine kinase